MESIILTTSTTQDGRPLRYVVGSDPLTVEKAINRCIDDGRFYPVPDRHAGGTSYVNGAQVVAVYAKPERH